LRKGKDPGAPDESIITFTNNEIRFDNGGGGFANGRYVVNSEGHIIK
jgi:hypothetical protein